MHFCMTLCHICLYFQGGLRAKLLTQDGNEIDTMFIDNRNDQKTDNGNTLVSTLLQVIQAFIMQLLYCFIKILCMVMS